MKLAHMQSREGRRGGKQFGNGPHIRDLPMGGRFASRGRHNSRADVPMPFARPLSERRQHWRRSKR